MSEAWEKRLCSLIKKYKSYSDLALFRNDYRDAVSKAIALNKISKTDESHLLQAREYLEAWTSKTPPETLVAFEQWQTLHEAGKDRLPGCVLEGLLRQFPHVNPGVVNWDSFLLSCSNALLVDVLLDRRFVREHDLNRLAQAKPAEFYRSVALDVLVERTALRDPRPLWDECIRGTPRPSGLLTRAEILVHCYAISQGDKENEQMLSFLLDATQDRERVLGLLLRKRQPAFRLCRFLAFGHPTVGMRAQDWVANRIQDVLLSWVGLCEAELEKGSGSEAETASLVLGLIRLSLLTETDDARPGKTGKLSEETARMTETNILHVLQKGEESRASSNPETAFVVFGKELYRAIQDYLRRLHVGTDTGQESPERALRFERYQGSKQVIEQVLLAMEESLDERGLRDALEVALFNCGVRPLGNVGEEVRFDVHVHEAETPGILPDDLVVVTHSGWCLGNQQDPLVLVKAKVHPTPRGDSA
jgi:hypothetical protein